MYLCVHVRESFKHVATKQLAVVKHVNTEYLDNVILHMYCYNRHT